MFGEEMARVSGLSYFREMWRFVLFCVLSLGCGQQSASSSSGGENGEATAGTGPDAGGAGSGAGGAGAPPGGSVGTDGCAVTLGGADEPIFDQTSSLLRLRAHSDFVVFEGAFYDGPPLDFHEEGERAGACRLLTYEPSPCDPACEAEQICQRGQCMSYPAVVSAGALELRGVGPTVIEVQPNDVDYYYWGTEAFGADAVEPIAAVSAAGAAVPAFSLETCVPEPLEPTEDWTALLQARAPGEDIVLPWSNPASTARIYLRMTTGIGTHGGISPVEIECEGRDVGTLTLPGTYLDALYADGWSCGECGGNELIRYQATETEAGATTIQLRAESEGSFYFVP